MRNGPIIVAPHPPPSLQYKQSPQSSLTARSFQPRPAIPDNYTFSGFRALQQIMYSLSTHEKLKEERGISEREILWRHLRNRKKSGRMVRRIYNKTREEMAHSCGERSQRWIEDAAANMESWSRAPEMSVHQHTFRDRRKEVEIGPANGHISARKYIPRLVLSGGGKIDSGKTADLMETLSVLSPLRGNDPNALHNPCRPTVIINDTAKILGRLEHPRWRAPKYVLRVREREKEIGPDVKYADRNDMEKILAGMIKNSVFAWGPYKGGGPWDSPTCRQEDPEKWVGDQKFYPGFRFRDNRGETLAGEKFPSDITNDGEYKRPTDFSRDCCSEEKLPRHRFCLVVRNNEYTRPSGKIRRSLCFKESPPGPYPDEKTYFTSLKAVSANSVSTANPREANLVRGPLCASSSLSSLPKRRGCMSDNKYTVRRGDMSYKVGSKQVDGGQVLCLLPRSKSSTVVRLSPEYGQAKGDKDTGRKDENLKEVACRQTFPMERSAGRAAEVSGGMRRVSEVATWASSGAPAKSARDYLW